MNTIIIAGITDSPWLVLVILLGGAVVNWLSSRRQQSQGAPQPEKPAADFDMEATLRRLLGQETQAPAAPPPIPHSTRPTPPPVDVWINDSEELSEHVWMDATPKVVAPLSPPPVAGKSPRKSASASTGAHGLGLGTGMERRRRSTASGAVNWRNRGSARQAFIASLVFGAPKGMDP